MFGTPIEERKDILLKLSLSEKTSLESIREDLNLKMSVVTTTSNNLEMFVGVRVDMIESLATALIAKKRGGDMEARIDLPAVFVDHILLPSLKLTTEFRPVNDLSSLSAGNYSQLVCRMVGNVKGLKKLGIHASKHPKWKNPFVTVEYISEEDAEIAPYFDEMRARYGGVLPYVVNPHNVTRAEIFDVNSKVRTKLGDEYSFDCSPHKVVHDIHIGRLKASKGNDCRNFGMKRWSMISHKDEGVVIDFVKPVEGSAIYRVLIMGTVTTTKFTGTRDVETGELGEALRDL